MLLRREEVLCWLKETDEEALQELFHRADEARLKHVGDQVHLRGLIEISNYCRSRCAYCGIHCGNKKIQRYRMTIEEVLASARLASRLGYGTVVLQSGLDPGLTEEFVGQVVSRITSSTSLAVTLSLGERRPQELATWRRLGAQRYLLRFETSDPALYKRLHPSLTPPVPSRFELLGALKAFGYEVGSGVMVGLPGQTYEILANDLALFAELDLDMIGVGPFITHPETPLGREDTPPFSSTRHPGEGHQVPNTVEMTLKVLALTRLLCPLANLPTTTAVTTLNAVTGRQDGLNTGGNVIMPNVTPPKYRRLYEIYPNKASSQETAEETHSAVIQCLEALGRPVGKGRGDSPSWKARRGDFTDPPQPPPSGESEESNLREGELFSPPSNKEGQVFP